MNLNSFEIIIRKQIIYPAATASKAEFMTTYVPPPPDPSSLLPSLVQPSPPVNVGDVGDGEDSEVCVVVPPPSPMMMLAGANGAITVLDNSNQVLK